MRYMSDKWQELEEWYDLDYIKPKDNIKYQKAIWDICKNWINKFNKLNK